MEDYSPSFEHAHQKAKLLMNEEFYFSPIEETAPFGSDDGSDTYSWFYDWRQIHTDGNLLDFLYAHLTKWNYPAFDIHETDLEKLKPYLKQNDMGIRYMTGIDAAIVAVAFGQLYLEGTIDEEFNKLAKTSINRELIPALLNCWGDDYKGKREMQLRKMLAVLEQC